MNIFVRLIILLLPVFIQRYSGILFINWQRKRSLMINRAASLLYATNGVRPPHYFHTIVWATLKRFPSTYLGFSNTLAKTVTRFHKYPVVFV